MSRLRFSLALLALVALTACGGGEGAADARFANLARAHLDRMLELHPERHRKLGQRLSGWLPLPLEDAMHRGPRNAHRAGEPAGRFVQGPQ